MPPAAPRSSPGSPTRGTPGPGSGLDPGRDADLEFGVLGPLRVLDGQGRPVAVGGPRVKALLAALLLQANQVVPTSGLVEALWEDRPPASWRQSLHFLVHKLRQALGPGRELLVTRHPGYLLAVGPDRLDLARFEAGVAAARVATAAADLATASAELTRALGEWRGPALADFQGMRFAEAEASRLEETRLGALGDRLDAELALGHHERLLGELEALTVAHPFREHFHAQLILARYRAGRAPEAMVAAWRARELLRTELGIEPGRRLAELERAVLARDPALDLPAPAAAPREQGEQREERKAVAVLTVLPTGPGQAPLDPEDARAAAAAGLAEVEAIVAGYGGLVTGAVGGTVVAMFGAPVAHDDDPERAVRAGLEVVAGNPSARVGVDAGEAVVPLGQGAGPPAGPVVELATALAAAAPPGRVLVGAAAWRATAAAIDYEPAGQVELGRLARAARPRPGPDAAVTTAGLVEREQELAQLRGALERVGASGQAQLVTLVGPPGIGKSRLVQELAELAEGGRVAGRVTWRQGRSLPYGDGVTFWALGEIVKAQAGILDTDGAEGAVAKLGRAAAAAVDDPAEAAWLTRHLRPLVQVVAARASEDRDEAFTAWRRFLEAVAGGRPLVAVFEDLQWADDALLDFIDELVDRAGPAPLLVLCSTRGELLARRPGWGGGKPNQATISLAPLSDDGVARLLGELLGELPGPARPPAATVPAIVAAAGGNPLFVEEYVRMLRDLGRSAGPPGAALPVPDTVRRLITARLDTLAPADRALLQDAAVLGQVGWPGGLASVSGRDEAAVARWLDEVERRDLVRRNRRSSVAGEIEFSFRHVLVRDVAYAQVPRAVRAARHERAAGWLAALGADRAEQVAHHWRQALALASAAGGASPELAEQARVALRTAGDRALALTAHAKAAGFYAGALELWPDEPGAERATLLLRLGEARLYGERTGQDVLGQARDALVAAGDRAQAAEAEMMLANLAWWQGQVEARDMHGGLAFALVWDQPPSRSKAYVLCGVATSLTIADQTEEAVMVAQAALEAAEAIGHAELTANALTTLGMARVRAGEREGLEQMRRGAELSDELRSSWSTTFWNNLALACAWVGDLRTGLAATERSVLTAERFGQRKLYEVLQQGIRAAGYYLVGRWDAAAALAEEVLAGDTPDYIEPTCWLVKGRILLAKGELDAADGASAHGLAAARSGPDTAVLQPALAFRARTLLALGRRDEAAALAAELAGLGGRFVHADAGTDMVMALEAFGHGAEVLDAAKVVANPWAEALRAALAGDDATAAELYARIGCPPDEARARLRAAAAAAAKGRLAAAAAEAAKAERLWRAMGATAYAAEAAALLAGTGGP